MERLTAHWRGKLLVINDLNLSLLITQNYCVTLEDLKHNFYNTFVPISNLKSTDPMHCSCVLSVPLKTESHAGLEHEGIYKR